MTTHTGTASIYLRLSAASDDDSTGLSSQEADLRRLAEERGLQVVAVRTDDGLSGALRNRPGFVSWLDDARSGRADHLLAWKIDRVSRGGSAGLSRFLDVVEGVEDDWTGKRTGSGVRFLSVADGLDSAAAGWDLQVAVLGALAKGERDAIRTRMLRHREANRADGRVVGGRRAWLFETAPRDGGGLRLVPVPAHADAVRRALEILRAGGSLGDVARDWTTHGVEPKGGGEWHRSPLRRVLSNPNIYGATTHRGALVREDDGTVRIDDGQAVLSLAEWQELQGLLSGRSTTRSARSTDPALLAGLLSCGSCGRVLYPHRPKGRTHTYRCRGGAGCERPTSVGMADAEEILVEVWRGTFAERPVEEVVRRAPVVDADEVARLEEALREIEERLSRDLPDDEALGVLRSRRDLRERLAALRDGAEPISERVSTGLTYGQTYDTAETIEERTRLLAMGWDAVVVEPAPRGGARGDVADRFGFVVDATD